MRHILVTLLIFAAAPVHAELEFDKWNFAELVVTGLKAAARGNSSQMDRSLEQIQTSLARLNLEINRSHPQDREAGLAMARELLTEPITTAWQTERVESALERQRKFMDRLFELGLGDAIAETTERLSKAYGDDISSVSLGNHLTLAGTSSTIFGGSIYLSILDHGPGPAMLGALISVGTYAVGVALFSSYNSFCEYQYKTNFISPVFRACELSLLRSGESNREEAAP